jgi:hypothetical protein
MGKVRGWEFDAVIGIGGKSPLSGDEDIAYRINWIGVNPEKRTKPGFEGVLVTFQYFVLYQKGRKLKSLAPKLFKRICEGKNWRLQKSQSLPSDIQAEITKLLTLAKKQNKTKRFPLIDASCVPPNDCLNTKLSQRATKRCRCPNRISL